MPQRLDPTVTSHHADQANDMNSTRNVDEASDEEEEEEEDSTLQKIRYSIQLEEADGQRPLSADSWERRLMSHIGASSFPGTANDTTASEVRA